jgi:hypothetical protein
MSDKWCALETFPSGFEADLAIVRLEAEDIPTMRDSHDTVGILGYGFQGTTARGVTVLVPEDAVEAAREILAGMSGTA